MQITNRLRTLSKFRLSWPPVIFFHVNYEQVITWFLLGLLVKFLKDYKLREPYGLVQFCCPWKIYWCLLTSICKRNHVIAYNCFFVYTFSKKVSVLKLADYDIILTNLALRTSLVIYHLIFDATRRIIVCD